jgi:hypothetical protein
MMLPGRVIHFKEVDHLHLSSILIDDSNDARELPDVRGSTKSYQPYWADGFDLQFQEILIDGDMLLTHIPTHTRKLFDTIKTQMTLASLTDQVEEIPYS